MYTLPMKSMTSFLACLLFLVELTLTLMPVSTSAAAVTINLCAKPGTATLTGATTVPIWGFGIPSTPGDCGTATASLPGPVLTVNEGDVVTINLTSTLAAGHTLNFEITGFSFTPGSNSSSMVMFTANAPGTYLYQSSGNAGRQTAMGLYGALIVRSSTAGQAYDTPDSAYTLESTLVLSQVDPNFNSAPDGFDMKNYLATYWLINGKANPDTDRIHAAAGQRVLLRYLNAGHDNTTMALLGMHERVLARDARLLNNPLDANAETIPAGATEDAIATVPSGPAPSSNGYALYNRQLHLTNGPQIAPSPTPATGGGMLTFIQP